MDSAGHSAVQPAPEISHTLLRQTSLRCCKRLMLRESVFCLLLIAGSLAFMNGYDNYISVSAASTIWALAAVSMLPDGIILTYLLFRWSQRSYRAKTNECLSKNILQLLFPESQDNTPPPAEALNRLKKLAELQQRWNAGSILCPVRLFFMAICMALAATVAPITGAILLMAACVLYGLLRIMARLLIKKKTEETIAAQQQASVPPNAPSSPSLEKIVFRPEAPASYILLWIVVIAFMECCKYLLISLGVHEIIDSTLSMGGLAGCLMLAATCLMLCASMAISAAIHR